MTCARCNGRGSITCTRCNGTGNSYDVMTVSRDCRICKGVGEIQCPACLGRPARMLAEPNERETASKNNDAIPRNSEFTTARQVQTILYLLEDSRIPDIEKTEIARFIEFLTGKNYHNIYAKVRSPLKSRDRADNSDLLYIKDWFRRLGLTRLVEKVESAINMKGV